VTVRKGPAKFHSKSLYSGKYSHTFRKKGAYKLYCTLHADMTETIAVK
jgi:plastocyanin